VNERIEIAAEQNRVVQCS